MRNRQLSAQSVFIQLIAVLVVLAVIVFWQKDFLYELYLGRNQSRIGLIINLAIAVLFVLGIIRICLLLNFYQTQADHLTFFSENVRRDAELIRSVDRDSLVGRRYTAFRQSQLLKAPVNHSALASVSVAEESSRLGFPKFVNNVLILTGVFGTIVSLSIALLGASDMIASTTEIGGLGTVIQGMSSALSTTMTAIIAFFIFSYFYQCLTDIQTNCISRLEYVTTTQIVPMFFTEPDAMVNDYSNLIASMAEVVNSLQQQHEQFLHVNSGIEKSLTELTDQINYSSRGFEKIIQLLSEGFRLSERDKH